jgi:hypothetical protein
MLMEILDSYIELTSWKLLMIIGYHYLLNHMLALVYVQM